MLLVTGSTGHSGRYFFENLVKDNYQGKIRCLVRENSNIEYLEECPLDIEFMSGDLYDKDFLEKALVGAATVLNISGIFFSKDIVKIGTKLGVSWFILIHTTGRYSKFKSASAEYIDTEDALLSKYKNLTILRPTMIYGSSRDQNMWKLIKFINSFKIFPVFGSGENLMQPVFAHDLADAYLLVLNSKEITFNKQYNLSGKEPISYISLLKTVAVGLKKKTIFIHFPIWLCLFGAYIYNFIFRSKAIITVEQIQRMNEDKAFSWAEAGEDFGFSPMSFSEGVKFEIEELQKR
jgi:nucleoside-diphosphate-sugar epimerase